MDAVRGRIAIGLGGSGDDCVGGKPWHRLHGREGDERGVPWAADGEHDRCTRISRIDGLGYGAARGGSIVLGVAPQLAVNYLLNPILRALALGAGACHLARTLIGCRSFRPRAVGAALVSVVVGGAIYVLAYAARPAAATAGGAVLAGAGGGVFTGGEPLSSRARLTAGDFSDIFLQNWRSFFRWTNVDRAYLGVWSGLEATSRALGAVVGWMERRALILLLLIAPVMFALWQWVWPGTRAITWRSLRKYTVHRWC